MEQEKFIVELGKKIRVIRRENNLTQQNLGELAKLSYKYVGEIERGGKNPSISVLNRIAGALEIDLLELLEIEPSGKIDKKEELKNSLILKLNRQVKNLKIEEIEKFIKIIKIFSDK